MNGNMTEAQVVILRIYLYSSTYNRSLRDTSNKPTMGILNSNTNNVFIMKVR